MAVGDANIVITNSFSNLQYNIKSQFGFHLVGQSLLGEKLKQREVVSYIEKEGEETAPALIDTTTGKNPKEAFDYELEFIYFNKTTEDFEAKINAFKDFLSAGTRADVLQIRNEYTNNKIMGYYKSLSVTSYDRHKYMNTKDFQEFKVVFRVPKPYMCNFNGTN